MYTSCKLVRVSNCCYAELVPDREYKTTIVDYVCAKCGKLATVTLFLMEDQLDKKREELKKKDRND